ncbi:MAG: 50S ribosome-binding GTPase [Deltaproteobacteria bacterium]|jgi:predicted GTPase|nr:50S ribosome-binding GTPase [Deltaproteobacteria bacterium]
MCEKKDIINQLEIDSDIKISEEQKISIREKINNILTYVPKIGVLGKTGVGKSSLCNALFGKDVCEIDDIQSCTRNPQEVFLSIGDKGLKLFDLPGLGENQERDEEYLKLYNKILPDLDVILWLLKGDDRAFTNDIDFYKRLSNYFSEDIKKSFYLVVNQIDKIEPCREWNDIDHKPGDKQLFNIGLKIESISENFPFPKSKIIAISAKEKYNLIELIDQIITDLPKESSVSLGRQINMDHISSDSYNKIVEDFGNNVYDIVYNDTNNLILARIVKKAIKMAVGAFNFITAPIGKILDFIGKLFH